jgi:archaellum component FlaC
MDTNRAFLIVCLTVSAVIIFNVMIYLSLRRGNETTTIDLMRKAAGRARNPWKDEDDALQELSNLVSGLKDEIPKTDAPDENGSDQE